MTYIDQMVADIGDYIRDNGIVINEANRDDAIETLRDELWTEDSVTGNGSGSYTMNRHTAMEYVVSDGVNYAQDMVREYGLEADDVAKHLFDWEWWDVSIRCYLLDEAIEKAIDLIIKEGEQNGQMPSDS